MHVIIHYFRRIWVLLVLMDLIAQYQFAYKVYLIQHAEELHQVVRVAFDVKMVEYVLLQIYAPVHQLGEATTAMNPLVL